MPSAWAAPGQNGVKYPKYRHDPPKRSNIAFAWHDQRVSGVFADTQASVRSSQPTSHYHAGRTDGEECRIAG